MNGVLLDTSALVDPPARLAAGEAAVSVVSLAELERGVLLARTAAERAARLQRFDAVRRLWRPLALDAAVAHEYAVLAATSVEAGRNPRVIDTQIAATARAHRLVLVTRDREQAELLDEAVLLTVDS